MPQVVDENVEKVFGSDWVTKYHEAIKSKKGTPKLKIENETQEQELLTFVKQGINPESPHIKYTISGIEYDIMIVQTPQEIRVNPMKFGNSVAVRYMNDWMSVIMDEADIERLFPDNTFILAGKYTEKPKTNGGVFKNFRCDYMKSFADLAQ